MILLRKRKDYEILLSVHLHCIYTASDKHKKRMTAFLNALCLKLRVQDILIDKIVVWKFSRTLIFQCKSMRIVYNEDFMKLRNFFYVIFT